MKLLGYLDTASDEESASPSALSEVTLLASPAELRAIADFLQTTADGMEERGDRWEHDHLADRHREFGTSPQFVVFNPAAT